jgi:hypothetical protein
MFNTALHRQITKQYKNIEQDAIANEKKNGTYSSIETPMPVNNSLYTRLSGFEKEYQKQVPVIAGGRANMEMTDLQEKPKSVRGRKSKSNLGMLYQDQLSQFKGSGEAFNNQDNELERDNLERTLGAGLTMTKAELGKDAELNQLKAKMGGSNKLLKKLPELVEGSDLKLEVVEPKKKRGRKPKAAPIGVDVEVLVETRNNEKKSKSKSPAKVSAPQGPAMKRRANKIKEIMKSMNKSMIEASKYIKENKIVY